MDSVSVIVPFFNSEQYLDFLFDSFEKCHFKENDEIILVNNGSTDSSLDICKRRIGSNKLYKLLTYTAQADSYAARNYGLQFAKGSILAFTDSDCKPTPQWLECVRNVKAGHVMAGNIILEVVEGNIWENYDAVSHLGKTKAEAESGHVATANMAVCRSDFEKVGKFSILFSGGDYEWSQRAQKYGLIINYNEDAVVYHPTRKTYEEIIKRERRTAFGFGKAYKLQGKAFLKLKIRYILRLFKVTSYLTVSGKLKKHGVPLLQRIYFVIHLVDMRFKQIGAACSGYKDIDARSIGIK